MSKLSVAIASALTLMASQGALAGQRLIESSIVVPTCYEEPADALISGIKQTKEDARKKCRTEPWLKDIKVKVSSAPSDICGHVAIRAFYSCER